MKPSSRDRNGMAMKTKNQLKGVGMVALAASLSACVSNAVLPDQTLTDAQRRAMSPTSYKNTWSDSSVARLREGDGWWMQMGHDDLARWVGLALQNNTDLRASLQRVNQAKAQAGIVSASRMPTVTATASSAQTNGGATAMSTLGGSSGTVRDQLGLQMNYEFDLWGKRGFAIESAEQQIRSSEFGLLSYQMSLTAEVAATYFRALALQERIALIKELLIMAGKNTADIRKKMEFGEATQVMLSQQSIFEQSLQAQKRDLELQLEQTVNQLGLLAGMTPSQVSLAAADLQQTRLPSPQSELPAQLLCRRPDLLQAEANLRSANADVAVARAVLLPNVSLSLVAGQVAPGLTGLTSAPAAFVQAGLSASQVIFDGGARKKGVALSEARRAELIEKYAGTVLAALRDVENALVGIQKTQDKAQWLDANRAQARQLSILMRQMLERGGLDFAQLIQIQNAVYTAEDAAITGRFDRILSQIELYKSLGGGMSTQTGACTTLEQRS